MLEVGYSPDSPKSAKLHNLTNISYTNLIPMLKLVSNGAKDGSFFTRSAFIDIKLGKKTDANASPLSQVLVVDADSSIDPNTGTITDGAPDPNLVSGVLKSAGWNYLLFRTHSYGTKGYRYRIVFPTDKPYTKEQLGPTLDQIFKELHKAGLYLRNAPENLNFSLAWYIPRKDVNDIETFTYLETTNQYDINVLEPAPVSATTQQALTKAQTDKGNPLGNGLIRIFNLLNSIPDLLRARGDIEQGYNRFVYSKSSSGTAGITVFDDLMYSHHADDPLADGEAHDAFDIHKISNNLSLGQALKTLKPTDIRDYVNNCSDDEILSDINRGLIFTSPQTQAVIRKILKVKLDLTMGVLKDESKFFKAEIDRENDDGLDTHIDIIDDYLSQYEIKPVAYAGQLYAYENRVWSASEVSAHQTLIANRYKANTLCKRGADYRSLTELLYTHCNTVTDFFRSASQGIAVNNRFLSVDIDGNVNDNPLDHEHKQRIHYDIEISETPPTQWLQTLDKTFDTQEEKDLLQEIFAATLFGMFPTLKKAALLKGTGDSGKSTILAILQSFIPSELQSASPPSDWANKEYMGNIAGKALNSVGEMDVKKRMSGNEFKKVIGNDVCEGRKLYVGVFNFTNTAAHIFNANEFPPTTATDQAFFSRWLILEFKHEIPVADRIKNFADSIIEAEKPQILGWILEGAKRLVKNQEFTIPANHQELINLWECTVSPFKAFVNEGKHLVLVPSPMGVTLHDRTYYSNDSIYKIYELWCRVNNIRSALSPNRLMQSLREEHVIFKHTNNNLSTLYHGIELNLDFGYTNKINLFDLDGIQKLDYKGNPKLN